MDALIAERVRNLRKASALSLDKLAELSGVSRSMISLIEREKTSPTAVVLNKLADALGVSLAALFADAPPASAVQPLARYTEQQVWTDPASGYLRRHVSPQGVVSPSGAISPSEATAPVELVEVTFPAGARVVFDNMLRHVDIHQQVWILEGEMQISLGEQCWHLHTGDCLAMQLGPQIVFHNPAATAARYAVVLSTQPSSRRA